MFADRARNHVTEFQSSASDDKIIHIYYVEKYTRMTFYDSHNSWWQPIKCERFEQYAQHLLMLRVERLFLMFISVCRLIL